jgi:23S rRNA pseudouridine2605 synthase
VPKTYHALVDGVPSAAETTELERGVALDDGMTAPAVVSELLWRDGATLVSITISEGRKRQVRRMFSAVGHPVLELQRVSFGPVELGSLALGSWRYLETAEIAALLDAVGMGS